MRGLVLHAAGLDPLRRAVLQVEQVQRAEVVLEDELLQQRAVELLPLEEVLERVAEVAQLRLVLQRQHVPDDLLLVGVVHEAHEGVQEVLHQVLGVELVLVDLLLHAEEPGALGPAQTLPVGVLVLFAQRLQFQLRVVGRTHAGRHQVPARRVRAVQGV